MAINGKERRKATHRNLRPKRDSEEKLWKHPQKRGLRVPQKTAAALAVMSMGITDYEVIASAVDLSVDEVRRIDMVEDARVRQLGVRGIPYGTYFKLYSKVRCPKCDAWITLAPCVACDCRRAPAEEDELDEAV